MIFVFQLFFAGRCASAKREFDFITIRVGETRRSCIESDKARLTQFIRRLIMTLVPILDPGGYTLVFFLSSDWINGDAFLLGRPRTCKLTLSK